MPRQSGLVPELIPVITSLYARGWSDEKVAETLDVATSTIVKWRRTRPELRRVALLREKKVTEVENSLFDLATGKATEEVIVQRTGEIIIRRIAPDVKAIQMYLFAKAWDTYHRAHDKDRSSEGVAPVIPITIVLNSTGNNGNMSIPANKPGGDMPDGNREIDIRAFGGKLSVVPAQLSPATDADSTASGSKSAAKPFVAPDITPAAEKVVGLSDVLDKKLMKIRRRHKRNKTRKTHGTPPACLADLVNSAMDTTGGSK